MIFTITSVVMLLPFVAQAQSSSADIHGLKPGMITREIILHSHAKLDTLAWNGPDGADQYGFSGSYLNDTGNFRINTDANSIVRVSFVSETRTVPQNGAAFHRALNDLTKEYGKPYEDYHNVYRIITWNVGKEQLTLTTTDGGKFYTVTLSAQHAMSTPGPDPNVPKE